ncbi:uncharacterized protein Dwil_GK19963 [Drosophila willistoni]|uniref:DNA 5'-3' helicase n=1 Tax=Drosophila willistoni TaxID=7260 RepID=B4MSF4_DROWI|nr:ATP-dependent DNA helicase DDX11 [Drosophila willistoni]EDW75043.1 uncharacterized protein Dwil_GK19963 [Drosophila willistoni]
MAKYSPLKPLNTPNETEFGFPYEPYEIQGQLMQQVFQVLESKQIGIFESPTGTGKSLTLTCAALTWLQHHEELVRSELRERIARLESEIAKLRELGGQVTDWISEQAKVQELRAELQQLKRLNELRLKEEDELVKIRTRGKERKRLSKKSEYFRDISGKEIDETPFVDSDNDSEHEIEDDALMDGQDHYQPIQIFYCSRTHSQLSQIVSELRKTSHSQWVRSISLGSRQQLCINPHVKRLSSVSLMNERCLDMAKSKTKANPSKKSRLEISSSGGCAFKVPTQVDHLRDLALSEPVDIEDLVNQGQTARACPYYASRLAQQKAQLILLPYQLLLQKSARQQLGIEISGSIVIIDEAHNLLDTLAQLHGSEINCNQLNMAKDLILNYKDVYKTRLGPKNLLKINQLVFIIKSLLKLLDNKTTAKPRLLRTYELTAEGDFFNINLIDLLDFCVRSRFAQKVQNCPKREPKQVENRPPPSIELLKRLAKQHEGQSKRKLQHDEPAPQPPPSSTASTVDAKRLLMPSPIRPILAFLETLTSDAADGRVLIQPEQGTFKYLLLNPAEHFSDIVNQARAIVIAGGTMKPTEELIEQLFANCTERVVERFYDHVVPPDAVLPFAITKGPTGTNLCFNYTQRGSSKMLTELSMILQNLCQVLPHGLVCFLPSYDYLDQVYKHLEQCGALARIAKRKRIFRESSGGGSVEQLLQLYAEAISSEDNGGALLLSVVGGKLSEGLNFADNLGRGVIVVGLPYPNRTSPELQERMRHLDEKLGPGAGNEYYENLCMKAVNQCIGRSVRHIRDYACVYLLDERYAAERIQQKLPRWIARHMVTANQRFGQVQAGTVKFFKEH